MFVMSNLAFSRVDELLVFFFKQKTAYAMRISDWSSDVCSSDLCFDRIVFASRMPAAQANSPSIYAAEKHSVPRPGSGICDCVFPRHHRHGAARARAAQYPQQLGPRDRDAPPGEAVVASRPGQAADAIGGGSVRAKGGQFGG